MEPRAIAAIVEKIARSPLSVSAYFKRHKLPFGRSRYFQYKAQLAANGLDGLVDGRSGGNRRELTAHAQGFIRGVHQENPQLSLRQIADRVESSCGIRVSRMTVSRCLRGGGVEGSVAAAGKSRDDRELLRRLRDYWCAGVAFGLGATHGGDDCSGTGAVSQDRSVSRRASVARPRRPQPPGTVHGSL